MTSYAATYWKQYKDEPSSFGGYALDALMLGVSAIKRAGGTNKEAVRSALENTKGLVGTTGEFNMSATDHMGLTLSAFQGSLGSQKRQLDPGAVSPECSRSLCSFFFPG